MLMYYFCFLRTSNVSSFRAVVVWSWNINECIDLEENASRHLFLKGSATFGLSVLGIVLSDFAGAVHAVL